MLSRSVPWFRTSPLAETLRRLLLALVSSPAGSTVSAWQGAVATPTATGPAMTTSSVATGGTPPTQVLPMLQKPPDVVEVMTSAPAGTEAARRPVAMRTCATRMGTPLVAGACRRLESSRRTRESERIVLFRDSGALLAGWA